MKTSRLPTLVLILGLTMLLSGNLRAAAPHYRYHTTGQGAGGVAVAVNDNGQVVVNFNDRAYLWTLAGGLTDLDDLGGGKSYGYAINNLGQIVGESFIDDTTSHAFLWDGQMHDLDPGRRDQGPGDHGPQQQGLWHQQSGLYRRLVGFSGGLSFYPRGFMDPRR
jgi:probable HAF family extracellular repeat protein